MRCHGSRRRTCGLHSGDAAGAQRLVGGLLEKDRHPRFHIGESLLPMNLPILQRLGLLEAVERIGVRKVRR